MIDGSFELKCGELTATYLSRGDHNADLLNGFGKLVRLDRAVIVEVEVLEGLEEDGFLVGVTARLLGKLLLEGLLETALAHTQTHKNEVRQTGRGVNDLMHRAKF